MNGGKRVVSVASDDRARIPFAMVGVLLLVSSITVVYALEMRPDPEVTTDQSDTIDITNSAASAELRQASVEAMHDAAFEPITQPASNEYGDALVSDEGSDSDEVFERYVKLRIYLEAQQRIDSAGQTNDNVHTTVSLDDVTTPVQAEEAIERVTLEVGGENLEYGDVSSSDLEAGKVKVTIEDIQLRAERGGETFVEQRRDISVTVGTPLFQLHERTDEYEHQLNTDGAKNGKYGGFGDYLSARLHRFAWLRGYAQNEGAPVTEVLANRHLETLANDGIFATQRSVFGDDDPYSDRKLSQAYACMLSKDARGIYDTPAGNSDGVDAVLDTVGDDGYCDGTTNIYDATGANLSDSPDWADIAGRMSSFDERHRISLDDTARTVFGESELHDEVQRTIDRIYTVDVTANGNFEQSVSVQDHPGSGWEVVDIESGSMTGHTSWVDNIERVVESEDTNQKRPYYELDVVFVGNYDGRLEWSNDGRSRTTTGPSVVRYDGTVTVSGEHSPDSIIEDRGMVHDYSFGPSGSTSTLSGSNYKGVPENALSDVLEGVNDTDRAEDQLEERLSEVGDNIYSEEDLVDEITVRDRSTTLHPSPENPEELRGWLVRDLIELEENVSEEEIAFDRHEMLDDGSPFEEFRSQVDDDEQYVYTHTDGEHYVNAPDKARAELRLRYMQRLRDRIDDVVREHEAAKSEFDAAISGHSGSDLNDVTSFALDTVGDDPHEPEHTVEEQDLLGDVQFVPEGSPAYFTFDTVESERVPSVAGTSDEFAPMVAAHESVFDVPSRSSSNSVQYTTAGEVLDAGKIADSLVAADGWDGGNIQHLETALDADLDRYSAEAGATAATPFDSISERELERAIRAEISALGPVEVQAIEIGEGETTLDHIAENVSREFTKPVDDNRNYNYGDYQAHLEASIRYGLDDALDGGRTTTPDTVSSAARLGNEVRGQLDDVDDEVIGERLDQAAVESLDETAPTATEAAWLDSTTRSEDFAPNRISSGERVTRLPMWDIVTANVWNVHLRGQYARFSVRASTGSSSSTQPTTYVREDSDVSLDIDGSDRLLGQTEKLTFETNTSVIVAVPSGGLGVGDRVGDPVECSETYDRIGPIESDRASASCEL